MTIEEALDIVVAQTGVLRYRYLCLEHPDQRIRDSYSRRVFELAGAPKSSFPSLARQAVSLAGAAARVAGAVLTGQPVKVAPEVYSERLEICRACEHYELATGRCRKCGCSGLKLELATEKCPIGKWS